MGGRNVTTFLDRGEEYEVILEGDRDLQRSIDDMRNIYVRSERTGRLISLSNLVNVEEFGAAQTLSRYNRVRAITLEANLAEGYRLGDALATSKASFARSFRKKPSSITKARAATTSARGAPFSLFS